MSHKKAVDLWGLNKVLQNNHIESQTVLSHYQFTSSGSPFILCLEATASDIYILLKNGEIIKVNNKNSKIEGAYKPNQFTYRIKMRTKVIDLSCGTEHSLARGRDRKVYSWGKNSFGQLGIGKITSEIEEPAEVIGFSQGVKIVQIYAKDYNSYCIDEDNIIYGFGRVRKIFCNNLT